MFSTRSHQSEVVLSMFRSALEAVSPKTMIDAAIKVDKRNNTLVIESEEISLNSSRLFLIGFGKAVGDMAMAVHDILGKNLQQGILSVPLGTIAALEKKYESKSITADPKYCIYEGAENNLPDENSLLAANHILNLARNLQPNDTLLVLISGGGSALLPAPTPPVTLEEKQLITKMLSTAGANIQELNVVRTHLSQVKGGKLAKAAFPSRVISLILSDVIGDRLDVIASGPTFLVDSSKPSVAMDVITKYLDTKTIPSSVLKVLRTPQSDLQNETDHSQRICNILIGNNVRALKSAQENAQSFGYQCHSISHEIIGEARKLGEFYAMLAHFMVSTFNYKAVDNKNFQDLILLAKQHGIMAENLNELLNLTVPRKIAVISGGESTVHVTGSGLGGRNQESVLAFRLQLQLMSNVFDNVNVTFLSAGTDGQDGPTSAAGAFSFNAHLDEVSRESSSKYLLDNDSYSFFKSFDPNSLIITGVTGTNVMDVHVLLLDFTL
ncbi:hypothetical protein CHUAL_007075 [Chamberlinius hualienensis]